MLTIPTEVIAVTVLMMVGMGLNLPACKEMTCKCYNDSHHSEQKIHCGDDGVSTYMSVNNNIQTHAVGLDECPRLYPILTVILGKSGQLHRNHKCKDRETYHKPK